MHTTYIIYDDQGYNSASVAFLSALIFRGSVGIFMHVYSDQSKRSLGNIGHIWPFSDVDVVT